MSGDLTVFGETMRVYATNVNANTISLDMDELGVVRLKNVFTSDRDAGTVQRLSQLLHFLDFFLQKISFHFHTIFLNNFFIFLFSIFSIFTLYFFFVFW